MHEETLPQHIAIIMDGNGRWAKEKGLSRNKGHEQGYLTLKKIVKHSVNLSIKALSVFAFSTENWLRPKAEVEGLMALFLTAIENETNMLIDNNVRIQFIGDRSKFSTALQEKIKETESKTVDQTGLRFVVAINYGGRWDIVNACQQLCRDVEVGKLTAADVDEKCLSAKLSTQDLPDPDLFIRTSGEVRISNFFLWQLAYTECYFIEKYWPDFTENDLDEAVSIFQSRIRRFGDAQS